MSVGSANADVVFSDDFSSILATQLEHAPDGWTQTSGNVDKIRSGDYSLTCVGGTGGCVDLDGTTASPTPTMSRDIALNAGQYKLELDISGNQRGAQYAPDVYNFSVTGSSVVTPLLGGGTAIGNAYSTVTAFFSLGANGTITLALGALGGDNVGPMFDNVRISTVPLHAAAWLLLSGLGGVAAFARRRRAEA